tara:strand:+ start:444109 stop:444726 length:618 start_codon:yes stop_codon:yes gene_type:complete
MKRKFEIIGFCLAWFAIITQFILMIQNRQSSIFETIVRFFSFFTILTNILVALYFTAMLFKFKKNPFALLLTQSTLLAITVFISIVGLVYQIALRSIWNPTGLQFLVDELLHTMIPLYVFVYWILTIKKSKSEMKFVFYWLLYPVIYTFFILLRGHLSAYYPYPFLNSIEIGYKQSFINISSILSITIVLMLLFIFIEKKLKKYH